MSDDIKRQNLYLAHVQPSGPEIDGGVVSPKRVELPWDEYEELAANVRQHMLRAAGVSTLGREILVYNPGQTLARTALQYMLSGLVTEQRIAYRNLSVL